MLLGHGLSDVGAAINGDFEALPVLCVPRLTSVSLQFALALRLCLYGSLELAYVQVGLRAHMFVLTLLGWPPCTMHH